MKVAMLGWEFPPFMAGGLGIHCLELTQGLARAGVTVDFYMPHMETIEGPLKVAAHHDHLRIKEVEADPAVGPYAGNSGHYDENFNAAVALYNQRLIEAFDSTDADVLHCHDWITVEAALELRRRTGIPLVFTVHSTEFDRSAGFMPQSWIEDIERRGIQGADRVIAVSRYTKAIVERNYGADPQRIAAVHNGVDLQKFNEPSARDYREGHDTVLFLSRLSRQKGPLYFLKAARRVLDVRPSTHFVVAGTGEMQQECEAFVAQNGMADHVTFPGFIPVESLADVYAQHDVYVLPSVSEPFGISVLEAMATGLPTIVSKSSGVAEGLAHVLKVEYWDTDEMANMILRLLESPALREELGRNGAKEVHRFTWAATASRTLDVYWRVLADRAKRPGAAT